MALFKISKGKVANLPDKTNEGYVYFTTDEHKFYIDVATTAKLSSIAAAQRTNYRVPLNAEKANSADKLNTDAGSSTKPVYFSNGIPVAISSYSGTSDRAIGDKDGNQIDTSYLKLTGGQVSGVLGADGVIAGDLLVTGGARFNEQVHGKIDNATQADNATTAAGANKLNVSAGNSTVPVYINSNGIPVAITNYSGKATTAGTADNATKATNDSDGNKINTTYVKKATSTNLIIAGNEFNFVPSAYQAPAVYFNYRTEGGTNATGITEYYFGSGKGSAPETVLLHGKATSANKINTDAGNSTTPVYFSNGIPVAITSYGGNSATATKATQDSDGNAINTTYLKRSGGQLTGQITTNSDALPQFSGSPNYLLGIEAFVNGGTIKWQTASNVKVGSASAADSATKLTTSRTISAGTAVTATGQPFDGTSNITIPIHSVKEAYLAWGGKDLTGTYAPIDAALVPALGANRLAFSSAQGPYIMVEYSRDKGATWTNYNMSDNDKASLFNGSSAWITIGKGNSTPVDRSSYMLRATINTGSARVYTVLNKFVILCSSNGSSGCYCTIQGRLQSNVESNTDTWVTFKDKTPISGWSGYNVLNTSGIVTYGNTKASQYGQLRFIFGVESHPATSQYTGLKIGKIMGFGGVGWTTPSTLASTGHVYSYNGNLDVTFPKAVTATTFYGALSGNASSADKLTVNAGKTDTAVYFSNGIPVEISVVKQAKADKDGNQIDTTYFKLNGSNDITANNIRIKSNNWAGDIQGMNAAGQRRWETYSESSSGAVAPFYLRVYNNEAGTTYASYKFSTDGNLTATKFTGALVGNASSADKVQQSLTSDAKWRPLLIGAATASAEGNAIAAIKETVYTQKELCVQPSTGTIRATHMKATTDIKIGKATITYNTTNQCLDFTFE